MRELLLDRFQGNIDDKITLLGHFTEQFLKSKINTPHCIFSDTTDKKVGGFAKYNYVYLNDSYIKRCLEDKKYLEILDTIFHECTHCIQEVDLHDGKTITYAMLMETKERVIRMIDVDDNYYHCNYELFSEEVEARYSAAVLTFNYLKHLGLYIKDQNYFTDKINTEMQNIYNEKRVYNGKDTTVSEMFDSIEDKPLWILEKFPILKLEFKIENNKIVPKDLEEIIDDYLNYTSNKDYNSLEIKQIELLYDYIIKKAKNNVRK